MANFDHLPLQRVGEPANRRKRQPKIQRPKRNHQKHAQKLQGDAARVLKDFRETVPPEAVDPSLVFKARLAAPIMDDDWPKSGLHVVSHSDDKAVIVFASQNEMDRFLTRSIEYGQTPPQGQKNPKHDGFFSSIDALESIGPEDRIGAALRALGYSSPADFSGTDALRVDVELWRPELDSINEKIGAFIEMIEGLGGEYLDEFGSTTGWLIRVNAAPQVIAKLLQHKEVAEIDLPPEPDMEESGLPLPNMADLPPMIPPADDAICIGIIDSGVASAHPLLDGVVTAAFGLGGLSDDDDHIYGHGTAVASIAAYGDVQQQYFSGFMQPRFRVASAKVVDHTGHFPQDKLAHKLVAEAIRKLHDEHGCRIINISLAHHNRMVTSRGSLWSESLDTLARELNILIILAAGNLGEGAPHGEDLVRLFPDYLLSDSSKLLDPAGSCNALTVGSIANVNGLSEADRTNVAIRHIALAGEPSPFTRSGLGIRNAIKPDLVDFGGTAIYDGVSRNVLDGRRRASAGILALNARYTNRFFSAFSGTSFAAPLVAWKAGVLLERFPAASANFLRTMLTLTAQHPQASRDKIPEDKDRTRLLGFGWPDITHAVASDDDRVILYSDDALRPNTFAVYELFIPEDYQTTKGVRTIDIALAFDPPVRRSRSDYLGIKFEFELVRGKSSDEVFEAFRALSQDETTDDLKIPKRFRPDFEPKVTLRSRGSCQTARFTMKRDISEYGDTYFLVVRCIDRWTREQIEAQGYTIGVMLSHEAQINLYAQLRARLALQV